MLNEDGLWCDCLRLFNSFLICSLTCYTCSFDYRITSLCYRYWLRLLTFGIWRDWVPESVAWVSLACSCFRSFAMLGGYLLASALEPWLEYSVI